VTKNYKDKKIYGRRGNRDEGYRYFIFSVKERMKMEAFEPSIKPLLTEPTNMN
jgi:hypothetical protein